jgi:hypothetical protein
MDQAKCRNCGTALTNQYCAVCGQREGREDLHVAQALGEIFGDIFTWDSRIWRTLFALIFRPGFLTAEFIAGRRASYVPPFRLYIIISFLIFLVLSVGSRIDALDIDGDKSDQDGPLVTIDVRAGDVAGDSDDELEIGIADEHSPGWLQALETRMETNASSLRDGPEDFFTGMLEYLPQLMFLMLPLFALILQILYLGSGHHYLQHLVFGLHFHSFVYLLYLLDSVFSYFINLPDNLFLIALLVYLPLALRRAFASSVAGALAKTLGIVFVYGALLAPGFVAISMMTLAFM